MNQTDSLTFGSLFSGIGGLDWGFELAGWQCKWQVEINPYSYQVLEQRFPNTVKYKDIRNVRQLEPVDLILGGWPCQPVSTSGSQETWMDERWLWPEFKRIVREIKPRWVLGENVRGFRSANSGWALGEVLRNLAQSGYDAEWDSIPAVYFGAPHLRERIFIVAYSQSSGLAQWRDRPRENQDSNRKAQSLVFDTRFTRRCLLQVKKEIAFWNTEPRMDRVVVGLPNRVDRTEALGESVVPQVAYFLGKLIRGIDEEWQKSVQFTRKKRSVE